MNHGEPVVEEIRRCVADDVGDRLPVFGAMPVSTRVYIAGPISTGDLRHNVLQATEAFIRLAKAGLSPWCPHWSVVSMCEFQPLAQLRGGITHTRWMLATAHGHPDMTHADWIRVDLAWVAVSDAVLRLPGESKGADMETEHATAKGIPVYTDVRELIEDMTNASN